MNSLLTPEQFNSEWVEIIGKYIQVTGNDLHYTDYLFANREKWAKTFSPESFDAGVNTTQRIEGYNSWIKRLVS